MNKKTTAYTTLAITLGLILPITALAQGLIQAPAPAGVATGGLIPAVLTIIDWVLSLVGLIAVIMIIFGGFRFIISGGNEEAAGAAKNTILYAIIGLIVIGLSTAIVNFVVSIMQTT